MTRAISPGLRLLIAGLSLLSTSSCHRLPRKKIPPYEVSAGYNIHGDSLEVFVKNNTCIPILMNAFGNDSLMEAFTGADFPLQVQPMKDTSIFYFPYQKPEDLSVSFEYKLGDPEWLPLDTLLYLPFPTGRTYPILQGYNGKFSHYSDFSRYAIDFEMPVGDTVTAAAAGVVIGLIEGYKHGGKDRKWRPYANYLTLFHPAKQIFTQYVHLRHQGALVQAGDTVRAGQAIGISGKTGFTSGAHLHFNVLKSTAEGLKSIPCTFYPNFPGTRLRRGMKVNRKK